MSVYRTETQWHYFASDCQGCNHPANSHSLILASEPCLDCDCPAYIPVWRPDPTIRQAWTTPRPRKRGRLVL